MTTNIGIHSTASLIGLNYLLISGIARTNIVQLEHRTDHSHQALFEYNETSTTREMVRFIPFPEQMRIAR